MGSTNASTQGWLGCFERQVKVKSSGQECLLYTGNRFPFRVSQFTIFRAPGDQQFHSDERTGGNAGHYRWHGAPRRDAGQIRKRKGNELHREFCDQHYGECSLRRSDRKSLSHDSRGDGNEPGSVHGDAIGGT